MRPGRRRRPAHTARGERRSAARPCGAGGVAHTHATTDPLVLLHGFMDSPATWELVRPALERAHEVLSPALPGHMGGPPLNGPVDAALMPDAVERAMDEAGVATAHIAGNSLGGFVALQLAARGRARSVVALAPAGGWSDARQPSTVLDLQRRIHESVRTSGAYAESIVATPEG